MESTWFCDLWNLVHTFAADVSFRTEDLVHGVWENDQSLMLEFYRIGYQGKDLLALNIVRHYRNLLHLSNISKCDGVTLDEYIVSDCPEISALHEFPRQEPTPLDHRLWREAISRLCLGTTSLPTSLGPFVRFPHIHCQWFTNEEADILYLACDESSPPRFDTYYRWGGRSTQYNRKCDWVSAENGTHTGTHFTSVTMCRERVAMLHSVAAFSRPPPIFTTFLDRLRSYGNDSLWSDLSVDGNGECIGDNAIHGNLCIAHDGSYMANKSQFLCSVGVIFYCRRTYLWLRVSITERSDAASNYRGELLGAVLALLILREASEGLGVPFPCILLHCDNRGVISHGNSLLTALSETQRQADLIQLVKCLSSSNNCKPQWEWVEGHTVERKGWSNCTLPERLNHQADKLAKGSLLSAINGGHTMEGGFPFEIVKLKLLGKRVSGSP